ncbi:hypothetical protein AAES_78028 [Amazona aestiva]|uniref:G-protein coupled receptors family 1 profile domain-containing protein n=1 Tax=Amazona aestiva TaxID=12930 RepID=A0A0Q3MH28_AMAAE|nr:hypothetical protein AAES_78028 [Amazona aestiva]
MSNGSSTTQFLLLAFADAPELQLLHFWLFLGIYLAPLLGNGLIIITTASDHRLHTPMYFFLLNFRILDLGFISTTVPRSMTNSLWDTRKISFSGCAAERNQLLPLLFGALAYLKRAVTADYMSVMTGQNGCIGPGLLGLTTPHRNMKAAVLSMALLFTTLLCTPADAKLPPRVLDLVREKRQAAALHV